MNRQQELEQVERELQPLIEAAIARGEDLSTPQDMQRFVERVLERSGYVLRGDKWIQPNN